MPNLASQMRVAFSSMAWNTGSSSPGDELMTCNTSEGRGLLVQRLAEFGRALALLIEQPHVFNGNDRLGSKVRHQLNLFVGEGSNLLAVDGDECRLNSLSLHIGTASTVRAPASLESCGAV